MTPTRDVAERERESRRKKRGNEEEKERRASGREYDEDGQRRRESDLGRNESKKDDEIGLCRGAVIQPNAQVCRRLAGASLECRPPSSPFSCWSSDRAGSLRAAPLLVSPPGSFLSVNPYGPESRPWYRDFTIHHYHCQLRHASASADARPTSG